MACVARIRNSGQAAGGERVQDFFLVILLIIGSVVVDDITAIY
jgi:hypothetical protein